MTTLAKPIPRYVEKLAAKRDKAANMRRVRVAVLARDKGRCRCCGAKGTDLHHVLYRSRGGKDTADNLVTVCRQCHEAIHGHALKVYGDDAATVRFDWLYDVRGTR